MLAGLRLAVSDTDVASISWSSGRHYFTAAQAAEMHSILLGVAAHHVTVLASSGDGGAFSDDRFGGMPVAELELPASDPLVLGVGGTTSPRSSTGAYIGETAWAGHGWRLQPPIRSSRLSGWHPGGPRRRGAGLTWPPTLAVRARRSTPPAAGIDTPGGTSESAPLWGA